MAEDIKAVTVEGSSAEQINLTMAEGKAAAPVEGPTAESLGVNEAQFAKFNSATGYNWQAHAKELQFAADQKVTEPVIPTGDTKPAEANDPEAQKVAESAGLNWEELGVKILNDGDISAEDYTKLAEVGVPKEVVSEYIGLLNDKGEQHVKNVFNEFGGEDQFEQVKTWAQSHYSEGDLQILEKQLGNPAEYKMAVETMKTKAGITSGPVNAAQGTTGASSGDGYKSQAEMVTAMRDPKYRQDAAYRATVEAKVAASKWDENPRQHVG